MYARLTTKLELVDSVRQVVRHVTRPVENVAILFSKLKQRFLLGVLGATPMLPKGGGKVAVAVLRPKAPVRGRALETETLGASGADDGTLLVPVKSRRRWCRWYR